MKPLDELSQRLITYMENSNGPSKEPWGTPFNTGKTE